MTGQTLLSVLAAGAIVVHFVCVCDRMTVHTDHWIRGAYGMIGMSALAVALSPFYGVTRDWADALAITAIAMFLILDRRR